MRPGTKIDRVTIRESRDDLSLRLDDCVSIPCERESTDPALCRDTIARLPRGAAWAIQGCLQAIVTETVNAKDRRLLNPAGANLDYSVASIQPPWLLDRHFSVIIYNVHLSRALIRAIDIEQLSGSFPSVSMRSSMRWAYDALFNNCCIAHRFPVEFILSWCNRIGIIMILNFYLWSM